MGVVCCSLPVALGWLPLPRLAGVTCERCVLLGANTPWKRVRFTRGLGTSAANARELIFSTGNLPDASDFRLRFRADASGNNDKVYIDDIVISVQ